MFEFYNNITIQILSYIGSCHSVSICYQKVTRQWEEEERKIGRKNWLKYRAISDAMANVSSKSWLTVWVECWHGRMKYIILHLRNTTVLLLCQFPVGFYFFPSHRIGNSTELQYLIEYFLYQIYIFHENKVQET